tara:strand:- start:1541 stop:1642 length:102 start_codon:yes stop_codon:yes gene_type:complete
MEHKIRCDPIDVWEARLKIGGVNILQIKAAAPI